MHSRSIILALLLTAAGLAAPLDAQGPNLGTAEGTSLLGEPLEPRLQPLDIAANLQARLKEARLTYDANPASADALIWWGRRTAYTGRYRDAIDIYTKGVAKHPKDARMYRHRGHRFLTLRRFEEAVADFEKAAQLIEGKPDEVEPDGIPNEKNIPVSSLHSNIWYHLGLAHYLQGNWQEALAAYEEGQKISDNPDKLASNTYWHVLTLDRLGKKKKAKALLQQIPEDLELIENHTYLDLLLLFQGKKTLEKLTGSPGPQGDAALDDATLAYGIGAWHLREGREEDAVKVWKKILESPRWDAFGYIAAEAEVARRRGAAEDGP